MAEDPNDHVTIREFEGFKEAIVGAIADSSSGIHKRLDGTDRRIENVQRTTNDLLRVSGVHATKLDDHERRLNAHGHPRSRKDDSPKIDDDAKPITRRDLNVAVGVALIVIAGIVWLFMQFGPHIARGAQP